MTPPPRPFTNALMAANACVSLVTPSPRAPNCSGRIVGPDEEPYTGPDASRPAAPARTSRLVALIGQPSRDGRKRANCSGFSPEHHHPGVRAAILVAFEHIPIVQPPEE